MKFKKGDKVIFIGQSNKRYAWELEKGKVYTVETKAADEFETYISVSYGTTRSSWYIESDFVSLNEARKLKLIELDERS